MLKGRNKREKAEYFWMYYKAPFLAVVGILAAALYWIAAAAAEKETAFYALLMDSHSHTEEAAMEREFAEYAGIDTDSYTVSINTSYLYSDSTSETYAMTSLSRFYADIGTEKLDVCGFLVEDFSKYASSGSFLDLGECMTEEELASYGDSLFYYEGKPVGIYADALAGMNEAGCYLEEQAVVGIVYNSRHVETAAKYLRFLSRG